MATLHCWTDKLEHIIEHYGEHSNERYALEASGKSFTCMLPDGHEGPHKWTSDNTMTITFNNCE